VSAEPATPDFPPQSISHRELRNESSRILREVQQGSSFVITNNGRPVALLRPVDPGPLHGVRYQPRVPGARFADIVPEPGLPGETALESLLIMRGER
jgi:prevent-host-death family protein